MKGDFEVFSVADPGTLGVRGELDLATAPVLEARIIEHVDSGSPSVVIDLAECTFVDPAGARAIFSVADRRGASIRLSNLSGQARQLFELLDLKSLVESGTVPAWPTATTS